MEDWNLVLALSHSSKLLCKTDCKSQTVVSQIKDSCTGDKNQQSYGCCLLQTVLSKCHNDLYEEHAMTWLRMTLKVVSTLPFDELVNLCYENLCTLLERSSTIDKLSRDVSTQAIDPILTLIIGSSTPCSWQTLKLTRTCIRNYPNACGRFYSGIQTLLLQNITNMDDMVRISALEGFSMLPLCGSGGEKKEKFAVNWNRLLKRVLVTSNHYRLLFVRFASGAEEDATKITDKTEVLEFPITSELNGMSLCRALQSCLDILRVMLSKSQMFVVDIPLAFLIRLFCDISNIINCSIKPTLLEEDVFVLKSMIMQSLLKLISGAISQFDTLLLPYYMPVAKVLISQLGFLKDRSSLYKCVVNLLQKWKCIPGNIKLVEEMVQFVIMDVMMAHNNRTNEETVEKESKKKKQKLNQAQRFAADIDRVKNNTVNSMEDLLKTKNCAHALVILEKLIIIHGAMLPENIIKKIVSVILNIFLNIYGKDGGYEYPYDSCENISLLFKVLQSVLLLHHDRVQMPIAILLSFFQKGLTSKFADIKVYCGEALQNYDKYLHGSYPYFRECAPNGIKENFDFGVLTNNRENTRKFSDVLSVEINGTEIQQNSSKQTTRNVVNSNKEFVVTSQSTVTVSPAKKHNQSAPKAGGATSPSRRNAASLRGLTPTSPQPPSSAPVPMSAHGQGALTPSPEQEIETKKARRNSVSLSENSLNKTRILTPVNNRLASESLAVVLVDNDSEAGSSGREVVHHTRKRTRSECRGDSVLKENAQTCLNNVAKDVESSLESNTLEADDEIVSILNTFVEMEAD